MQNIGNIKLYPIQYAISSMLDYTAIKDSRPTNQLQGSLTIQHKFYN